MIVLRWEAYLGWYVADGPFKTDDVNLRFESAHELVSAIDEACASMQRPRQEVFVDLDMICCHCGAEVERTSPWPHYEEECLCKHCLKCRTPE